MQTIPISTILSQEIAFLPLIQQQQVLDYVRQLKAKVQNSAITSKITDEPFRAKTEEQSEALPAHIVGKPMRLAEFREKFAGIFSKEDLTIMSQVIAEDCGRIDLESW